jgi:general L-amino acid transport system permease protein
MTSVTPDSFSSAPPEVSSLGPVAWMKKHLFSDWFNSILTIIIVTLLGLGAYRLITWAFTTAQWEVIPNNLGLFMTGTYPSELYARIWVLLAIMCALAGFSWGVIARNVSTLFSRGVLIGIGVICAFIILFPPTRPSALKLLPMVAIVAGMAAGGRALGRKFPGIGKWVSLSWFISYFAAIWLIGGGLGLTEVSTNDWGGLVLTLFTAVTGIALCFPLGIILALGRRSALPVVRWLSTAYIEVVRGVPLVAFLFMGQVMIPLFLPEGARPDRVLRAIIALSSIQCRLSGRKRSGRPAGRSPRPAGSRHVSGVKHTHDPGANYSASGFENCHPRYRRAVHQSFSGHDPAGHCWPGGAVGHWPSILANPNYLGRYAEVYLFLGVIYWIFCYAMSLGSRKIEQKLNTEN